MLCELNPNKTVIKKKRVSQKLWLWEVKLVTMNKTTNSSKNTDETTVLHNRAESPDSGYGNGQERSKPLSLQTSSLWKYSGRERNTHRT